MGKSGNKNSGGIMKVKKWSDYKNPDKKCKYPFSQCGVGYCWGYANLYDKAKNKKELKKQAKIYCKTCDFINSEVGDNGL